MGIFKRIKDFFTPSGHIKGNEPTASDVREHNLLPNKKYRRSFGGTVKRTGDRGKDAFNKKHLNAYMKGKSFFMHGRKTMRVDGRDVVVPDWHQVDEVWKEVKDGAKA